MAGLPSAIALVHEWFSPRSLGGAELVVRELDALLGRHGARPALYAQIGRAHV